MAERGGHELALRIRNKCNLHPVYVIRYLMRPESTGLLYSVIDHYGPREAHPTFLFIPHPPQPFVAAIEV